MNEETQELCPFWEAKIPNSTSTEQLKSAQICLQTFVYAHISSFSSFCISLESPVLQVMLVPTAQELPDISTMESHLSPVTHLVFLCKLQGIQSFRHALKQPRSCQSKKQRQKTSCCFAFIHEATVVAPQYEIDGENVRKLSYWTFLTMK